VAEAESGYAVDRPAPDRAEGDVAAWRRAFDEALAALLPRLGGARVRAVGLSGQMHGAVLVDAAGTALRPALLWPDQRATAEVLRWRALPAADRAGLANPLVPGMTGPLLAWLAVHEPDDWSPAAVAAGGISPDLLPAVRPGAEVAGHLTGPLDGVPLTVGGADTALALLAAGATGVQVNLGTGAQVLRPLQAPVPADDPPVHCYAGAAGGWYAMAALQNGGSAWQWVCGVLGLTWAELFELAESVPPGAGGVVFSPFLTGERGGVAGPGDRGSWSGLHQVTTRADLARAAVEGVAAAVAAGVGLLDGVDDDGEPVLLTGGGARTAVVQQAMADALRRPVRHLRLRSASATGAAVLAGRGTGADVEPRRQTGPVVEPSVG
jgi:xylulokinase